MANGYVEKSALKVIVIHFTETQNGEGAEVEDL